MSDIKEQQGGGLVSRKLVITIIVEVVFEKRNGEKVTEEIEVAGVIDTKSTINCMKHEMGDVLGLQPIRQEFIEQVSDGARKACQFVRLQGFRLGGRARNLGIGDLDAEFLVVQNESMTCDFVLGTDFLQDYGAVLDFADGTITLGGCKWNMYPTDLQEEVQRTEE